ncbi:C-X-C motif chemokine 11-1-like isoform X2 [Notolabrus celidotus]|nr:C-X-C motif chemokine 11-1-like isoform X2 [Notolabrus celidotus]
MVDCRCLAMNKNVRFAQIHDVEVLAIRPYCNHEEVIVTLKDGTRRCLNPKEKFTQALVKTKKLQVVLSLMRKSATSASTMAPTTATFMSTTPESN